MLDKLNLSGTDYLILIFVAWKQKRDEPINMVDLIAETGKSRQWIKRRLPVLEKEGLITCHKGFRGAVVIKVEERFVDAFANLYVIFNQWLLSRGYDDKEG